MPIHNYSTCNSSMQVQLAQPNGLTETLYINTKKVDITGM